MTQISIRTYDVPGQKEYGPDGQRNNRGCMCPVPCFFQSAEHGRLVCSKEGACVPTPISMDDRKRRTRLGILSQCKDRY